MKLYRGLIQAVICVGVTWSLPIVASAADNTGEKTEQRILWPADPVVASKGCLDQIVADKMGIELSVDIPLPKVKVEGPTTLQEFQEAATEFWNFTPEVFLNIYQPIRNQIFLMSDSKYYLPRGRSIFDSLVHEIVHSFQVLYQGAKFDEGNSDQLESEAVQIQTWFREQYGTQVQGWNFECPTPQLEYQISELTE